MNSDFEEWWAIWISSRQTANKPSAKDAARAGWAARAEAQSPNIAALKVVRAMIRGDQIEYAIVDMAEPHVGLGEWLDRRISGPSTP